MDKGYRLFFSYNLGGNGVALAIGAAVAPTITIDADSPFRVIKMTGVAINVGLVDVSRQLLVQISDTDQSATWFQQPRTAFHIFGAPGLPYILPEPRMLGPKATITIQLQNISGAAMVAWIAFDGYKIRQ